MKANPSCNSRAFVVCLAISILAGVRSWADIGGGSGRALTPYRQDRPVVLNDVETVKRQAAKARDVNSIHLKDSHASARGSGIGVMFVTGNQVSGTPMFEFRGLDAGGRKTVVDFSVVDTVSLVQFENNFLSDDRAQLEIKLFPDVTPKDLLSKNPTYTQLRQQHERTVRLWIPASRGGGGELAFVAQNDNPFLERSDRNRYEVLAKLRDIEPNMPIEFLWGRFEHNGTRLPAIWWAIQSVIKDEKYPHKAFMAQ
jgi:hypothetical protein